LRVVNKWISIVLTGINGIVACYFSWFTGLDYAKLAAGSKGCGKTLLVELLNIA
jgi:hypothetical protein